MGTVKKIILISSAIALPVAVVGGIAYAKHLENNITTEPSGFNVTPPNNGAIQARFVIDIINKTDLSFVVKNADCNIFINNEYLGVAVLEKEVLVAKYSRAPLAVTATFKSSNLASYALSAIGAVLGGSKNLNFLVVGNCKVALNYFLLKPFSITKGINETFSM